MINPFRRKFHRMTGLDIDTASYGADVIALVVSHCHGTLEIMLDRDQALTLVDMLNAVCE